MSINRQQIKKIIKWILVCIIIIVLLFRVWLILFASSPFSGIWENEKKGIVYDTNGYLIHLEWKGEPKTFAVSLYEDTSFDLYPSWVCDEGIKRISPSDRITSGTFIQFGDKAYIKSVDGEIWCWLERVD